MRKLLFFSTLLLTLQSISQSFLTRFEKSGGTESPTYPEMIKWWKTLAAAYPSVKMMEMGPTDAGYPLHLILVSTTKNFDIKVIKRQKKNIIFINNGIHPGEPDGIDASMLLIRDIVQGKYHLPSGIVLGLIPVYNIGGTLNRSPFYRIDQNGPVAKGFRGNSQNLDLNRDFIKMDSKDAFSFAKIFHYLEPDIFIDNHVSNGADYQHVMTLLVSQPDKLGGVMGDFMRKTFEPSLYQRMKTKGFDLIPYVNHFGEAVDKGWPAFYDGPRYGSGYGTLWNTFSFVPETHMLKPYQQRVAATKALMESFIEFTAQHGAQITQIRTQVEQVQQQQAAFPIAWKWDRTKSTTITFKGFEAGTRKSEVSGLDRLYYNRNKPYVKEIPFYNSYIDTLSVTRPKAYILPQGWWKVAERLKANGIVMEPLKRDTILEVDVYRVDDYKTTAKAYEGHHLNSGVQVSTASQKLAFRKGDYYISTNQKGVRFLMETLEPQASDSYFAWNFFDPVLGQKEGFSDYAFEDSAAAYLRSHPELREKLRSKAANDQSFSTSAAAQLNFVYQNSPFFEFAFHHYPVYRLLN